MSKALRAREVCDRLREYDWRFEFHLGRGKGSHFMISHPDINGRRESAPCPSHSGKTVSIGVLHVLIRRFNLPRDIFD
jgi:predicted RNA binding protein YcfA (HicA-like mRNA interferase family)